jgi:DNA-binding transcriptional MerR regulator
VSDSDQPIFSIGAVARQLGLPPATIRTWEARYGLVVPRRSAGGQRLYSREQVGRLRFVAETIASGSRPGEAHRLLAEQVRAGSDRATSRIALAGSGTVAALLLRQLLERSGFVVDDEADVVVVTVGGEPAVELSRELMSNGHRVLAIVEEGAQEPAADAVLRLPIAPDELVDAARRLTAG